MKRITRRDFGAAAAASTSALSLGGALAPAMAATPPSRKLARPTAQQLAFQEMELGAFIH